MKQCGKLSVLRRNTHKLFNVYSHVQIIGSKIQPSMSALLNHMAIRFNIQPACRSEFNIQEKVNQILRRKQFAPYPLGRTSHRLPLLGSSCFSFYLLRPKASYLHLICVLFLMGKKEKSRKIREGKENAVPGT